MRLPALIDTFDASVNDALMRLDDANTFDALRHMLDALFHFSAGVFTAAPWWLLALLALAAGWRWVGGVFAIGAALGLWLCQAMGLWQETMATLTLVLGATALALAVAIPAGIVVGLTAGLARASDVALDFIQTMPAYIYLLPGIALLGYGPATALWATSLVAIPPAMRLTAHGVKTTQLALQELGVATGASPMQALIKIRLPSAYPAIMAGVNQSLMIAFGMVVIAGIVGSGGLGQTVYEAVRTLQIAQSINAGIAIVVLSIILDRFSQRLASRSQDRRGNDHV